MRREPLYWEDVEEGASLPPIVYELSLTRMVAAVRATGLFDFVHFDRDYARAAGARDAFISTPHLGGLLGRLLTDWSGPHADLRSLSFTMSSPSCAGDVLTVSGRVGRKSITESGERRVDIVDLKVSHAHAPQAASGEATLALPSRTAGAVQPAEMARALALPDPDPQMPDAARAMLGQVKPAGDHTGRPLTEDEIHLWCECLEDWNPLYWDHDFAKASRFGGIVAPPQGTFFGAGSSARMGIGYAKPGVEPPAAVTQGLTGLPLLNRLREDAMRANLAFTLPGFPEVAVARARSDYYVPLRPGDTVRTTQQLVNCSARKKTRFGEGHFVTLVRTTCNQRGEIVRTITMTILHYHA